MVYIPNMALTRFQENQGNPMVEALCNFIVLNLERPLEQVASWGVEVSDKPSRTFYLRFTDGTHISGQLAQVWQVQTHVYEPPTENSSTTHQG
jgi:hypothetical protein